MLDGCLSNWKSEQLMYSQGWLLGRFLFVLKTNDLDEYVCGWISNFADDIKTNDFHR